MLLGLLIEQNTVTDTKRVRQTLEAAAAGLVANDKDRVKECIVPGPDGDAARAKTDWAFRLAVFREVSISNLEVKFNYRTSPPTAETTFMVYVRGKARGGEAADLGEIAEPRKLEVQLRKQSGRWLVYGDPKVGGFQ